MKHLVLDCSVAMSWCFEDQTTAMTDRALDSLEEYQAIVPGIWPLEVANVLLVAERHSRLTIAESVRFLELLRALPILVEDTDFAHAANAVLSTARENKLSSYDASYLELAMRTGANLATLDRGLRRAARKAGVELFQ